MSVYIISPPQLVPVTSSIRQCDGLMLQPLHTQCLFVDLSAKVAKQKLPSVLHTATPNPVVSLPKHTSGRNGRIEHWHVNPDR